MTVYALAGVVLSDGASILGTTNAVSERGVQWGQIINLHLEQGELVFKLGPLAFLFLIVSAGTIVIWKRWLGDRVLPDFELVEAELEIAKLGKVKIKPNHDNSQVAHRAWVELMTRKAAVPFEDEHDVIVEVYDSYYNLFAHLRDLAKSIPAQKLRDCPDTRKLVDVMVRVLNHGLRPHLTRWQARFRRWYDQALLEPENRSKSPQEVQKEFPEYSALVADLKLLQNSVVKYAEFLKEIAQGRSEDNR